MQQVDADPKTFRRASECQPKLLEQFNEKLSTVDQSSVHLLMAHLDKILSSGLGTERCDLTMEDYIPSGRELDLCDETDKIFLDALRPLVDHAFWALAKPKER